MPRTDDTFYEKDVKFSFVHGDTQVWCDLFYFHAVTIASSTRPFEVGIEVPGTNYSSDEIDSDISSDGCPVVLKQTRFIYIFQYRTSLCCK